VLTQDEWLKCWAAYFNWTANGKRPEKPPIPDLKKKYHQFNRPRLSW